MLARIALRQPGLLESRQGRLLLRRACHLARVTEAEPQARSSRSMPASPSRSPSRAPCRSRCHRSSGAHDGRRRAWTSHTSGMLDALGSGGGPSCSCTHWCAQRRRLNAAIWHAHSSASHPLLASLRCARGLRWVGVIIAGQSYGWWGGATLRHGTR